MQDNLMQSGIELMVYGMGTVFVFLTVLVIVTMLMSAIVQRFTPVAQEQPDNVVIPPPGADDKKLIAIISAAVHQYRSRHK